ncbi:N/A [soil metagenome]
MTFKTKTFDAVRKTFTVAPFEAAMLSVLSGVRYGGFWSRFIPGPHLYRHGSMRKATRDGINYELDVSCLMQWYVFWGFKEKQRDRLYSLVKAGDVVFDVGTNIGETLLHFGKMVGMDGYVYGFEPDEENFKNVQRNISLNDAGNLHVFNFGVSDKKETVKLYRVDPNNLGMNRILNETEAERFEDYTTIETDTLDNVIAENKIERVDAMKIDIEGYEMHALRGATQLLTSFKPKLFIEVGYTRMINNGTSPTEMVEYLKGFGYKIFHAETDHEITAEYDFSPLGDGGIDVYAWVEK